MTGATPRKRYQKWVESGSPPAHECRLMGEADDDRPLYYPYANLVQRFLNDWKFHHQMTGARVNVGKRAWS
eukprot:9310211-Pyramimonas_sp.AAC.1